MAFNLTAILQLRDDMSAELRNAIRNLDSAGTAVSTMNTSLGNLAKVGFVTAAAGVTAAAAGAGAFAKMAIEAAADAEAMNAQFEQVFGELAPAAQKAIDGMGKEFDMVSNRLKPAMSQMTSMFKGLGIEGEDAMSMATSAITIAADAAAFNDIAMESAQGSISSFLKGNYEAGEAIGVFGSAAAMTAFASKELGKDFDKLDEAGKQVVRLKFAEAMMLSAEATGQAARESDSLSNQVGNLKQLWKDFLGELGKAPLTVTIDHIKSLGTWLKNVDTAPLIAGIEGLIDRMLAFKDKAIPAVIAFIAKAKEMVAYVQDNWVQIKSTVLGITAALGSLYIGLNALKIFGTITALIKAYKAGALAAKLTTMGFNTALLMNPFTWVVVGIAALIGVIVYLVNRFDWAKNAMDTVWGAIKTGFSAVMNWLKPYVTSAMDVVMQAFNSVKNYVMEVMPMILTIIKAVWSVVGPIIKHNLTIVMNIVKLAFNTVKDVISWALNNVLNIIKTIWGVISGVFKVALQLLTGDWSGAWNTLVDTTLDFFSNIGELFSEWVMGALDIGKNFLQGIIDGFLDVSVSLFKTVTDIWDSVMGIFDGKKSVEIGVNTKSNPGGVATGTKPKVDGSHYNGLSNVPYNGYCVAA